MNPFTMSILIFLSINLLVLANGMTTLNAINTIKMCECMEYWTCINVKGIPYSYCGLNDICCLMNGTNAFNHDNSNNKKKLNVCGRKGRDSGKYGVSEPSEWPWHVALLEKNDDLYVCGGSLINERTILTAAHCIDDYLTNANSLKVRLGEHDVSSTKEPEPHYEYDVARIIIHPRFNNITLESDLALIILKRIVKFRANVNTICLSGSLTITSEDQCIITGWGKKDEKSGHSRFLKEIDVPIWRSNKCENTLKRFFGKDFRLPVSNICAGAEKRDACDGDGGGPLVCRKGNVWYQLGIVSYGIGCGRKDIPGVYTDVRSFYGWIIRNI